MSALFGLMLAGHLVGDWLVQTDWQAANKALPSGWLRANQMHCLTYHLTMAVFVVPVWHTRATLAAFAVSWATHGFIDRRWPVRRLLRATGSRAFAELTCGVLVADQALHIAILAVMASLVAR